MNVIYHIIVYKNNSELDDLRHCTLEEMLNFIKEYEDEANKYKIITFIDGTEVARDIITK